MKIIKQFKTAKNLINVKQKTNFTSKATVYQVECKQCSKNLLVKNSKNLREKTECKRDLKFNYTLSAFVYYENNPDHNFDLENSILIKAEYNLLRCVESIIIYKPPTINRQLGYLSLSPAFIKLVLKQCGIHKL